MKYQQLTQQMLDSKMLGMNQNGVRRNARNKYECDQRQYLFRGQKKFDQNIQKICYDIVKKPEIETVKKIDQNQIQIEKLLIKCRDLEEDEFRNLIDKYQNKDEFYQQYFQKDSEGMDGRGFMEQMQEQIGQIKKTIQNTNLSEQIKTMNVHVKNNYMEENRSNYQQSLNTNQNNNIITNFQQQKYQSDQESAQTQTQQNFFPTQMNVPLLKNPSENVLNFQIKKNMQRTNAQIRLYSATYNRQLKKKQEQIKDQKTKQQHFKSTRREMVSTGQIPPVLNDVAQKAERIFSAQNNMKSRPCLVGVRATGSANSQYRKYHCKTHLE